MRYRSRRDLLDIALDPAFVAQHECHHVGGCDPLKEIGVVAEASV